MTENSLKAFYSTMEQRPKNKEKVLAALRLEGNHSRFWVGRMTGLDDIESQRRLSDLMNDDLIVITGSRKHGEHDVSLYSIKQQLDMFPVEKKLSFLQYAKKHRPEWVEEYKLLELHEL